VPDRACLVELKQIFRHLLDALRDAIAVQRPKRFESLQNIRSKRAFAALRLAEEPSFLL